MRNVKKKSVVARELYDHAKDPGEMKNLAANPEHQNIVEKLGGMLEAGWPAALPQM